MRKTYDADIAQGTTITTLLGQSIGKDPSTSVHELDRNERMILYKIIQEPCLQVASRCRNDPIQHGRGDK